MNETGYRELLVVYLKGLAMGSADAVPGVSGGTIALITGIYERLIDALTSVNLQNGRKFFSSLYSRDKEGVMEVLEDIDSWFIMTLGVGIGTSIVLVLNLIHVLLTRFTAPTYGFFFGLIAFSAVVLMGEFDITPVSAKLAGLFGFSFAFAASGLGAGTLGHELSVLFIAGMLAVSAMVLPGISGSLILVILGQYEYITGALSEFTGSIITLFRTGNPEDLIAASPPILVFIVGATVGLFSVVHLVERALERHRNATMAFLVSMIVGALRAPMLQVSQHLTENSMTWEQVLPGFAGAAVLGAAFILLLDLKTESL
jgi:putative membrane protein